MKNRVELYAIIKEHNLEEDIKDEFGDNYTRISSKNLEDFLEDYLDEDDDCECDEQSKGCAYKEPEEKSDGNVHGALVELVSHLVRLRVISPSDADDVLSFL